MSSILVVECDGEITRIIEKHFAGEGYQAVMIENGNGAVQFALREMPDLIILDAMIPDCDGYAIVKRLRDHPKCMHIPVIMLSSYNSLVDKVRAYEAGVDSYILKPCCPAELLAHIRRHLSRMQQNTLSPLTRLPGGLQLERAIDYKVRGSDPWCILYLDLDNFKAFNDAYGFLAGNDMILLVSSICQRVVYDFGNVDDFVGHIGGDDFVIVTTPDREQKLCCEILAAYRCESRGFYHQEDVERGSIHGIDRRGRPYFFPLVSLSIGVVSDQLRCSQSIDEIGSMTAEAKRRAKQSSNNVSYVFAGHKNIPLSSNTRVSSSVSSFHLVEKFGGNLFHFVGEDAFAEFKS